MKLTEQRLKQIIKEELKFLNEAEEGDEFGTLGSKRTSKSQRSKDLRQGASDITHKTGVDSKELGIIGQMEELLSILADKTDIKAGPANAVIKAAYKRLKSQLQKILDLEKEKPQQQEN